MLLGAAVALLAGWPGQLRRYRRAWPFVLGAGAASVVFGLLYGEFFGPTGLLPVLWLAPLEKPVPLLVAALGVGAVLLSGAYVIGIVNRWREGGWPVALYEPSGIAGASAFLGLGVVAAGLYLSRPPLTIIGGIVAGAGLALAFAGFLAGAGGGGTGVAQAIVELFDLVVRLGANVVSFARLAAFGLAHAALAAIVWSVTAGTWARGGAFAAVAVVVFAAGTAVTFALEALVAGVQALRLEYYELFSRLFRVQGRPFRPWHIPIRPPAEREGTS
jgi:V/A-type H+/Na+-transporting ATPase subunit I